jgi:hypothetical protein
VAGIALVMVLLFPALSFAAEPAPGDTCTADETGKVATTAGSPTAPKGYFVVCDGSAWSLFLGFPAAGDVGIATGARQGGMIAPLIASTAQLQAEQDRLKSELAALQADREQTLAATKDLEKQVRGLQEHIDSGANSVSRRRDRTSAIIVLIVIVLLFGRFRLVERRAQTPSEASRVSRRNHPTDSQKPL